MEHRRTSGEMHTPRWRVGFAIVVVAFSASPASAQDASGPVFPGLHDGHPLDVVGVGRLLLAELNCDACHAGLAAGELQTRAPDAPDLSAVGGRVAPDYLQRFIGDPSGTQRGTKMPALLHSLPEAERDLQAQALTHFLVARSERAWSPRGFDAELAAAGEELFHTTGCVACHAPRRPARQSSITPAPGAAAVDLGHVPAKYSVDSLAEFLFQPLDVRPAGRMPDMGLKRGEARALANYLIGPAHVSTPALVPQPDLVANGRRAFETFNCNACHELEGLPVRSAPATAVVEAHAGCVSLAGAGAARFELDLAQRAALGAALQASSRAATDSDPIATTLMAFGCTACHVRDDYGGVRASVAPYFETDEPELGEEARIPPQLTLAGAKLQGPWLRKVLFDRGSARTYMRTRMPHFGESNLAHLPELFEAADAGQVEAFAMPIPKGDAAGVARDGGRELMGIRGLACIMCHDFNGIPGPTHGGVDLINTTERLQPNWFARFLIAPQTYRPGIVMPESWSGGVAAHTTILDGDTDAQIRALWYYLSQGRTARAPEGMHPAPSKLVVADTTRTYRGRSRVAGYRGIAVGFPGGLSYAFNAQTGALSALWRGEFVSVRWDSQGAGDFDPLTRSVALAQDVSFCRLADDDAPWPLRPHMDDEHPVNPDPTYPRNHGYRFRGYHLDERSVPRLRYASGDVEIEDRSEFDVGREGHFVLRRVLEFNAPSAERLYFRVLTGDYEARSAREFQTDGLRLGLPDRPTLERPVSGDGTARELLIRLDLPAGPSSVTLHYELVD